jgi:hypothetical protein
LGLCGTGKCVAFDEFDDWLKAKKNCPDFRRGCIRFLQASLKKADSIVLVSTSTIGIQDASFRAANEI